MTTTQHSQPPSQHALPDPGEQVPTLSWPIVGIFTFALVPAPPVVLVGVLVVAAHLFADRFQTATVLGKGSRCQ